MRSILGMFSLLAFGFLAVGVFAVVASGSMTNIASDGTASLAAFERVDLGSMLLGFAAGVLLSAIARISWAELPRRTVEWLMANERNFARLAWVALFAAILFFY